LSGSNIDIGLRLKEVRNIMNEGSKLSAEQFAYLLEETGDRIRNYELGRAGVPVRLLYNLYYRGINPIYIITGEESIYANNAPGKKLKSRIEERQERSNTMKLVKENEDMITKAAAGRKDA
jgi:hypothetical protein